MLGMKHNLGIWLLYIPGMHYAVAGALLRFRNETFWKLSLDADIEMMPPVTFDYM